MNKRRIASGKKKKDKLGFVDWIGESPASPAQALPAFVKGSSGSCGKREEWEKKDIGALGSASLTESVRTRGTC